MNSGIFYLLLLCLASGFTQCLLICCSIVLLRHHNKYQFQRTFAVVLLMLSVAFFNNFVVSACQNLDIAEFINSMLILYDYVVVGGFMIFIVSLVFPGRFSAMRLSLFEVPYVIAIAIFSITSSPLVLPAAQIYTLAVSLILLVWLEYSIKKYNDMLRDNVSSFEYFDLRWGSILVALLFIVQLIWGFESLSQQKWFTSSIADRNLVFDTLWCIITIVYVLIILKKIIQQQVIAVSPQDNTLSDSSESAISAENYYKTLAANDIDSIIRKNGYHLDSTLTLQSLATSLGTNRQYLSNYINREKQKTFYEYINDFRLEEAKKMMDNMDEEKIHSIEDIATQSGFNSYSTFLRCFVKKYGVSPSKYLKVTFTNNPGGVTR